MQRRGTCPIHGQACDPRPTFSAHLGKNVYQCFHADCRARGNVLDLWAAVHHLPLYDAALHLAEAFQLLRNREEEPVERCSSDAVGPAPTNADSGRLELAPRVRFHWASIDHRQRRELFAVITNDGKKP